LAVVDDPPVLHGGIDSFVAIADSPTALYTDIVVMKKFRVSRVIVVILCFGVLLVAVTGWFLWRHIADSWFAPARHVYTTDSNRTAVLLPNQRLIFDVPAPEQWRVTHLDSDSDIHQIAPLVFIGKSGNNGGFLTIARSPCDPSRQVCSLTILVLIRTREQMNQTQHLPLNFVPIDHQ
jgi:hypothetical protein